MSAPTTSTIYTVGTALRRAQDSGLPVAVLVEGQWFDGQVAGVDGDGLVLVTGVDQAVIRMSAISVVRVRAGLSEPAAPSTPETSATVYEAGPVVPPPDEVACSDVVVIEPRREHDSALQEQRRMLAVLTER